MQVVSGKLKISHTEVSLSWEAQYIGKIALKKEINVIWYLWLAFGLQIIYHCEQKTISYFNISKFDKKQWRYYKKSQNLLALVA